MTFPLSSVAKYALVAALSAAGMYWIHRLHGKGAHTRSLIRANDVSDDVLVERVRAAIGRATSHAGAIEVSCLQGVVTLKGAILKHEHPRVMRAARSASGIGEVHDELAAYKQPDELSALQGGHSRPSGQPGAIASP